MKITIMHDKYEDKSVFSEKTKSKKRFSFSDGKSRFLFKNLSENIRLKQ